MVVTNNQQGTSKAFTLTIGGIDYLTPAEGNAYIPVNEFPITWSDEVGNSVGTMSVTVYDPNPLWADRVGIRTGDEVMLRRSDGNVIFGGVVAAIDWEKALVGRYAHLRIVDFNAWLDWRIVPRLHNKKDVSGGKKVRYTAHDGILIKSRLFGSDRRHGPLTTYGGFVENTTHASDPDKQLSKGFEVEGATLRTALEEIAEEANYDGVPRLFYVDYAKRLHYYKRREDSNPAPFRLTDQEYAAMVTGRVNAAEFWPLTSDDGTGRLGVLDLSLTGLSDGERLVPNQPGYSRRRDGSGGASATSAGGALTCSSGWAVEFWVKPSELGNTVVYSDSGPNIVFLANGTIRLTNAGDATSSDTDSGVVWTGSRFHLVVGQKADGTNYCYRNGIAQTFTTDNATACGDGWSNFALGSLNDGDYSHAAWYTGDGLTEAEAREHYLAGIAIVPEGHRWTDDSETESHQVYVRGKNADGSGWVGPTSRAGFSHPKQSYLTKPKVDTTKRRNRTGWNFLRRQENRYTGSFYITDPDHAVGWRAGQTLYSDDTGIGLTSEATYWDGTSRQPYEVVAVSGELAGGNSVRLDIEYGVLRRTMLRTLSRKRG